MTNEMEFNRFGYIAVILLVVGCLGGLTVGMGAIESTLALTLVVIPTMVTLSFLIAVAPMRWIMMAATASVGVDAILLLYYVFT